MRRVTLEFNYQDAWKQIFGSNAEKVEILDDLRCFKCDLDSIAIICRIKLKDKSMNLKDLIGKGLLTNIELLYKEKDGSQVVFIEGRLCISQLPKSARLPKLLVARPPDFLDVDRMKVEAGEGDGCKEDTSKCKQMEQYIQGSWTYVYR